MKKLYASALFAAVAAVALMGGCQKNKQACNQDAAAATADGNAGTQSCSSPCAAKDGNAGTKSCSSPCSTAKDGNAGAGACTGAKGGNAGAAACTGAKGGNAGTAEGGSKGMCPGTKN